MAIIPVLSGNSVGNRSMLNKERKSVCSLNLTGLFLTVFWLVGGPVTAPAQLVTTLIQFTNSWSYDQTGRNLASTLWKTNTYVEDAFWNSPSPGLLGVEPDSPAFYTIHAPISTPLTVSSTVTSFYFRTVFTFSGPTNGLSLIASSNCWRACSYSPRAKCARPRL